VAVRLGCAEALVGWTVDVDVVVVVGNVVVPPFLMAVGAVVVWVPGGAVVVAVGAVVVVVEVVVAVVGVMVFGAEAPEGDPFDVRLRRTLMGARRTTSDVDLVQLPALNSSNSCYFRNDNENEIRIKK